MWTLSQNDEYILYRATKCPGLENNEKVPETPRKSSSRFHSVARVKGNRTKKLTCEVTNSEVHKIGDVTETKLKPDDNSLQSDLLRKYFRLDVSLKQHYAQWAKKDPHFEKAAEKFTGVRILCQDPVENLFSFICSSNNNIARFEILSFNCGEDLDCGVLRSRNRLYFVLKLKTGCSCQNQKLHGVITQNTTM